MMEKVNVQQKQSGELGHLGLVSMFGISNIQCLKLQWDNNTQHNYTNNITIKCNKA